MHQFTDNTGHTWTLRLNLGAAERIEGSDVSAITGSDKRLTLFTPDQESLTLFITDIRILAFMAYCILLPEMEAAGIDQDAFKDRLDHKALLELREAMHGEIENFTQLGGISLSRGIEKLREVEARIQKEILPQMEAHLDQEITRIIGETSGQQPPQSTSTTEP